MSDNDQLDVLIAVYLIPDLAQQDFDAFVKLAKDGAISTDGVALVTKDAEGEVAVQQTGDHLGRKGARSGEGWASSWVSSRPPSSRPQPSGGRGRRPRQGRAQARAGGHRREDGRRAATRLGGDHRDLRP